MALVFGNGRFSEKLIFLERNSKPIKTRSYVNLALVH